MAEGPRWVELTRTVGEINARLIAGDLENEDIRTHIELAGSAWFYAGEDPNRMATIYVLEDDLERARSVLEEASSRGAAEPGDDHEALTGPRLDPSVSSLPEPGYAIVAEQETGLRSRPLRWLVAAVILGALAFGVVKGDVLDFLNIVP